MENQLNIENHESPLNISAIESSPVLDIVAIGTNSGNIFFLNLKKDSILFSFRQNEPVLSMAFSQIAQPLLATGDIKGNIIIWDMNE